ncbi:MAG: hypothetical protein AB1586_21870 [Pseudomonadota bacterium]
MDDLSLSSAPPDVHTPAAPRRDALARLTGLGPRGGLAAILLGLAFSFFALGFTAVYWRNADMDFMVIYNALALNDGRPQQYFDHPAYLTILSVKLWFQLLHALGWLDGWTLSAIPPAGDRAAFDAAMLAAVRAGRVLAFLIATACVLIFGALIRRIVRDWRLTLLATFAFAFSGGVAVHMRILRSEMLAACGVVFALLLLIIVGRRAGPWRPLLVGLAAACCVLGLENKVHAILLIAALPVLLLPFGSRESASVGLWTRASGWIIALGAVIAALLAVAAAWPLIAAGLAPAALAAAGLRPIGTPGTYQTILLIWLLAGMVAYAALWRISAAETLAAMAAALGGAALALLALRLSYNIGDVVAVMNPLERMLSFADPATASATDGGVLGIARLLLDGVRLVLMRLTFVLYTSPRPAVFLTWLIIPGIVYAWRRGERQVAIQALLLLLVAIGIDALGVRRGLKAEYFIFTDPLIILAGAVLLDRLSEVRTWRFAYPIGAALFTIHIVLGQSEPVHYMLKRSGPEEVCAWNVYYLPLLPLPWCKDQPPRT